MAARVPDPYACLGLNPNASIDEINKAFDEAATSTIPKYGGSVLKMRLLAAARSLAIEQTFGEKFDAEQLAKVTVSAFDGFERVCSKMPAEHEISGADATRSFLPPPPPPPHVSTLRAGELDGARSASSSTDAAASSTSKYQDAKVTASTSTSSSTPTAERSTSHVAPQRISNPFEIGVFQDAKVTASSESIEGSFYYYRFACSNGCGVYLANKKGLPSTMGMYIYEPFQAYLHETRDPFMCENENWGHGAKKKYYCGRCLAYIDPWL